MSKYIKLFLRGLFAIPIFVARAVMTVAIVVVTVAIVLFFIPFFIHDWANDEKFKNSRSRSRQVVVGDLTDCLKDVWGMKR